VCGDDKGSLWLYNLPEMVKSSPSPLSRVVDPTTMLMWPELQVRQYFSTTAVFMLVTAVGVQSNGDTSSALKKCRKKNI
jgi:hypothetical protein